MNETQAKLLDRGVLVMPGEVDHEAYEYLLEALLEKAGCAVQLFCRGDGGESRYAFAIVDLIRQHGRVIGLLAGEAISSHVIVWAACAQRFVYSHGGIGLHQVESSGNMSMNATSARLLAKQQSRIDEQTADLLASISHQPVGYWSDLIHDAGSDGLEYIGASRLIEFGMARPISEYRDEAKLVYVNGVGEGTFSQP